MLFKLAPAPDTVKKTAAQMDISGLNLLLAEDNELNAEIAETLLSDEGANMTRSGWYILLINISI